MCEVIILVCDLRIENSKLPIIKNPCMQNYTCHATHTTHVGIMTACVICLRVMVDRTSDSGLSRIRRQYKKPLYNGHDLWSQYNSYNAFEPHKEENLSTKNTSAELIVDPQSVHS